MNLDEQLAEILSPLGVVLETAAREDDHRSSASHTDLLMSTPVSATNDLEVLGTPEASLFQTSREHYGVFYRLDLVAGRPQLRVFVPDDEGSLKMRCFLVRPIIASPIAQWFSATRHHDGSPAYLETRDVTEQHLLFAAGESLKRLFWSGDPDAMRFPAEVLVSQLV